MKFVQLTREYVEANSESLLELLSGWSYLNWTRDNLLYELPNKWELSYAFYVNNTLAGFFIGSTKIEGAFYMHLLYVSKSFRSQAIGSYLFNYIKRLTKKYQLTCIEFRCPESNTGALQFYQREGCEIINKLQDEVSGTEADFYLRYSIHLEQMSYIIAEIGNNHNGKLDKAIELIHQSFKAGVDAVKFQSFRGIDIVSPKVKANEYKGWDVGQFEYWHEFLDTIALKLEDHQAVIDETLRLGMDFITTPTSPYIVSYLENLEGIAAYKIASMDLNNIPLLNAVAKTKKPLLISTGMGEIQEVKKAVTLLKNNPLTILHCVSDYPLNPSRACLGNITTLIQAFPNYKIGFSDHSLGHELCVAARCLGATVFEKHITIDRNDPSPAEHHFALTPSEFKILTDWLRHIDTNFRKTGFQRSESEKVNKFKYRRSYHFNAAYKKGEIITLQHVTLVRPGNGIDEEGLPQILGKPLVNDVNAFDPCLPQNI
jgi:sialic acid synthase SpsE/GNAT superfamily N-acetyltransferase